MSRKLAQKRVPRPSQLVLDGDVLGGGDQDFSGHEAMRLRRDPTLLRSAGKTLSGTLMIPEEPCPRKSTRMFDERAFVTNKQAQWQELTLGRRAREKARASARFRPGSWPGLGLLYRRAAADLAYARTQRATAELVFYLNELVGQGHGVVYQQPGGRSDLGGIVATSSPGSCRPPCAGAPRSSSPPSC